MSWDFILGLSEAFQGLKGGPEVQVCWFITVAAVEDVLEREGLVPSPVLCVTQSRWEKLRPRV